MKAPLLTAIIACSLLCPAVCRANDVLEYLKGVEVQCEESQKENIVTALNDALTLTEEKLSEKKYPNYSGEEQAWSLRELIERHFVPDAKGKDLGDNFYEEVKSPKVQKRIQRILRKLQKAE